MNKKQNFRELLAKAAKTYQVKAPSGLTYELRRPNIQGYLMGGKVPTTLLETMIAAEGKTPEQITQTLETKDAMDALEFTRNNNPPNLCLSKNR